MTADEFRVARRRLGLSIPAMARKLGVHPRTVSKWQSGERPVAGPVAMAVRMMLRRRKDE